MQASDKSSKKDLKKSLLKKQDSEKKAIHQPADLTNEEKINETLQSLLKEARLKSSSTQQRAEKYSLYLITLAQFGDKYLMDFHIVAKELQLILKDLPENSWKALICSRMLFASAKMLERSFAYEQDSYKFVEATLNYGYASTKGYLDAEEKTKALSSDSSSQEHALALGHMASAYIDDSELRERAKKAADRLASEYLKLKAASKSDPNLLSNTIWAYVLLAQAAANANQRAYFDYARDKLKVIMFGNPFFHKIGQRTTRKAIANGLTEADYPSWAIAIMAHATAVLSIPGGWFEERRFTKFKEKSSKIEEITFAQIGEIGSDPLVNCDLILGKTITDKAKKFMTDKLDKYKEEQEQLARAEEWERARREEANGMA